VEPFTVLSGVAAPLFRADINTDAIIPMRWLVTATRAGLGGGLFGGWRYRADGTEEPAFVLNRPEFRNARILIAGANFGCGSSREHAPWALLDFGVRCIVAPGFASIFFENCLKNGILPAVLPERDVEDLARWAQQAGAEARLTVDLTKNTIVDPGGRGWTFDLEPSRRAALLEGRDEIDDTLVHAQAIAAFQARDRAARPWIYEARNSVPGDASS
jgi:3-isopropylmalate/(R)-2-methylmalate dehydratase small subunit